VRFISSVQTVTAVSESGGRLKVPHKKRGTDEARSKSIASGKGTIYIKAISKNFIPAPISIGTNSSRNPEAFEITKIPPAP
jgi:hypothetical protein